MEEGLHPQHSPRRPGCTVNKHPWEDIVKHGRPKALTEVSWVDESVVLRGPMLYVPGYYRAVEVVMKKRLAEAMSPRKVRA